MEKIRPSIGVLYSNYTGARTFDYNSELRPFSAFAKDFGFRVIELDPVIDRYAQNRTAVVGELVTESKKGLLCMLATNVNNGDNLDYEYEKIRELVGDSVPVFGINEYYGLGNVKTVGNNLFLADPTSFGFLNLLKNLRDNNSAVKAEMIRLAKPEIDAILNAHKINFPDIDVDDNTRIVLGYLRWNFMYPTDARDKEFDSTLPLEELKKVEDEVYDQDLKRLASLSTRKRNNLSKKLSDMRFGSSRMSSNGGYAIDPKTLLSVVKYGYGSHLIAPIELETYIKNLKRLERKGYSDQLNYSEVNEENFIKVVAFVPIAPYKTPFLLLNLGYFEREGLSTEDVRRVIRRIKNEKIFIPITRGSRLLDSNFTFEE